MTSLASRIIRCVADSLEDLRSTLRGFADAREWAQFHTLKNLALALTGEVGELATVLQWLPDEEVAGLVADAQRREALADEMADVLIYLVRMADVAGIDLLTEAKRKVAKNALRYPVEEARGRADKYTQLSGPRTS